MESLPDAVLRRVLCFVGDAQDFRSCEKTCKVLRNVLQDDKVWRVCPRLDSDEEAEDHFRERASVYRCIQNMKYWQRSTTPVILTVLTAEQWGRFALVMAAYTSFGWNYYQLRDDYYRLRGDTSAVLLTIVEQFMVDHLVRAFSTTTTRAALLVIG